MCRQQKLLARLDGCQVLAGRLDYPPINGHDRIRLAIESGEEHNMRNAEILIDRYVEALRNHRATHRDPAPTGGAAGRTAEVVTLSRTATRGVVPIEAERPRSPPIGVVPEVQPFKLATPPKEDVAQKILSTPPVTPRVLSLGEERGLVLMNAQSPFKYCGLSDDGRQRILRAHNLHRQKFRVYDDGVADLLWSDELGQKAQAFAEHLVSQKKFAHSTGGGDVGENITNGPMSLDALLSPEAVVNGWYKEIAAFNYDVDTRQQRKPGQPMIGHFTQVISRRSTHVGAGVAKSAVHGFEIWVCNYSLHGNMWAGGGTQQLILDTTKVTKEVFERIRSAK